MGRSTQVARRRRRWKDPFKISFKELVYSFERITVFKIK